MANRPYSLVVYVGEGDDAYPHQVGVFWKADDDKKIAGTIQLYMFPGLQIRMFPPREEREEKPREKQREPKW